MVWEERVCLKGAEILIALGIARLKGTEDSFQGVRMMTLKGDILFLCGLVMIMAEELKYVNFFY